MMITNPHLPSVVDYGLSSSHFREGLLPYPAVRHKKVESKDYQQIGQSSNDVCIEMDLLRVGSEPVGMRCPYCQEDVMTKATYKNSSITHLVAIILGVLFWWLCCCFIPYVIKRWKNVEHYCPSCKRFLGVFSRTRMF